ncbi:MAG TPA: DUF1501 domain-containing protein [Arcobacter sp.]|nr:DUF1501 domain-containing protein [Arcobacter sp.]
MNRRDILKLMTFSTVVPNKLLNHMTTTNNFNYLILIELQGGNDGLNTVIPYANPLYYQYRPNIGIDKKLLIPLNEELALHPSLKELKEIYDSKELAIALGIGYEHPNRSHFRSIDIWNTASDSDEYIDRGWLAGTLNKLDTDIGGIVLGGDYGPLTLASNVIKVKNIDNYIRQAKGLEGNITFMGDNKALEHILNIELEIQESSKTLLENLTTDVEYYFPKSSFYNQMDIATRLVINEIKVPVIKLSLKGFDTHINQPQKHANLLKQLSEGLEIMRRNLIKVNKWSNVIIMTYSEFGRRVQENGSKGTDHGSASPHFIVGGGIRGSIYGEYPSLSKLDENGDLVYTTNFREIYQSILHKWLGESQKGDLFKF